MGKGITSANLSLQQSPHHVASQRLPISSELNRVCFDLRLSWRWSDFFYDLRGGDVGD